MALNDPFMLGALGIAPDMWKQINVTEMVQADLIRSAQQAQQVTTQQLPLNTPTTTLSERARELFLKRLGGIRGEYKVKLGDFIATHIHAETVYVFFCFTGREGVVKESIDLFPSDQLITQFRMILS